jgi:hypothetical protein
MGSLSCPKDSYGEPGRKVAITSSVVKMHLLRRGGSNRTYQPNLKIFLGKRSKFSGIKEAIVYNCQ